MKTDWPRCRPAASTTTCAATAPTCRSSPTTTARTTSPKAWSARAWTAGSAHDTGLQPAFAARFDWGFPFRNGSAEVCNGCREGTPDAGGHTDIVGGTRLRIDRRGNALPDSP